MRRAALWLALGLALAGCQTTGTDADAKKLTTAKLDTALILQSDPEYMTTAQDYLRQQTEVKQKYFDMYQAAFKKDKHDEAAKKAIGEEYQAAQQKLDTEWQKKTEEFVKTRHDAFEAAARKIAADQGIDMVLVDSKQVPTVEYGGIDITQEVMAQMHGGGAATPEKSP